MNYKDAAILQQSWDDLARGLLQKQMLQQSAQREADENAYRQQEIGFRQQLANTGEARYNAQQAHYNKMEQAQSDAAAKAQQGQDLRDKQQLLSNLIQLNATGQLSDLDSVNDWLANDEHFGKTGIQLKAPPSKPDPQAGQNAVAQAFQQANQWRQKAQDPNTPAEDQERFMGYAEQLEAFAHKQANPAEKPSPDAFQDVTVESQPGGSGTPKTTVKTKVPKGQPVGPQPRAITDKQGKKWLYKGTMDDPTKDKNPANWEPAR